MARTTEFLTDAERRKVLAVSRDWKDPNGWGKLLDLGALVDLVLLVGIHPTCLAHPAKVRLRLEPVDGLVYLRWIRAKKTGPEGEISFPLLEQDLVRFAPLIQRLIDHPYSTRHLHRLFANIGKAAGVPGFSFRSARHTAQELAARGGMSTSEICTRFGVSLRVAMIYQRGPSIDRDRLYLERELARRKREAGGPTP